MGQVLTKGDIKVPVFTVEQLEYLNRTYPEDTSYNDNPNNLYMNLGARNVIKHIELQIERSRGKRG